MPLQTQHHWGAGADSPPPPFLKESWGRPLRSLRTIALLRPSQKGAWSRNCCCLRPDESTRTQTTGLLSCLSALRARVRVCVRM